MLAEQQEEVLVALPVHWEAVQKHSEAVAAAGARLDQIRSSAAPS